MCSVSGVRTTQTSDADSVKAERGTGHHDCRIRWTSLSQSSKAWTKDYSGSSLVLGWIWNYLEIFYSRKADDRLGKMCFSIFYRSWGPHEYICLNILPLNPMGFSICWFPSWVTLDLLWGPKHGGSPTLFPSPQNPNHLSIWAASSGEQCSDPCLLVAKFFLITLPTDERIKEFPSQLSLSCALNAKKKWGRLYFLQFGSCCIPKVKLNTWLEDNKTLFA